jgi:Putative transposase/Transposase zinc-binding domain
MIAATYIEYARPQFEVADVFRLFGDDYRRNHNLPLHHRKVMRAIENCRTAALGGHVDECSNCGALRVSYNSCRDRHCPKCQNSNRQLWVEARKEEVLPIPYFHVVFTLPEQINSVGLFNQAVIYNLLFRAASETLLEFGHRHLSGEMGITAVLHTWGQSLQQHLHLHCIVTGGGLSPGSSEFRICKKGFLFPTRALAEVFQGKFCDYLQKAWAADQLVLPPEQSGLSPARRFARLLRGLRRQKWVVYAKRPFAGPEPMITYLGRYTHRVAISNNRIIAIKDGKVSFLWKDYRDGESQKIMTVTAEEFIRRFLLHVLPEDFVRIRHYGLLSNGKKKANLTICRQLLSQQEQPPRGSPQGDQETAPPNDERQQLCPACGRGRMVRKMEIAAGNHPKDFIQDWEKTA